MVYNTENGASFQKLPDKLATNSRKKIQDIIVGNEEKESQTLNTFLKLLK